MYSVYLVEDEALVLADIQQSIPWIENNFYVAGSNTDSSIAYLEIKKLKPDVVFTDLKMPGKSGFDLIREIREQELCCEFVVISAYETFEYARELMLLDGFDYLVKPVLESQFDELFQRLLTKLEHKYGEQLLPNTSSEELNRITAYLNRNLTQKHSLQTIAHQFTINPNYICKLFSKHLDTTFSSYLTRIRMEHAARLLKETNKTVKEIAAFSGYYDYFYFCRIFRGYYQCTPTQYRGGI